jgi:hypothetical protein
MTTDGNAEGPARKPASREPAYGRGFGRFAAEALVPEQIPAYARSVSGREALICGECIAYAGEGDLVLVGYPLRDPRDRAALDEAVALACRLPVLAGGGRLTVLCAVRPSAAPRDAECREDTWWALDLPPPSPGQKLRNTLRRTAREVRVERGGGFGPAHQALVREHILLRPLLAPGARLIYSRLPACLALCPRSELFSAYSLRTGKLVACAVGEYSGLRTAFYLFAFRAANCPPGAADALLSAVLDEAERRGHARCNLGLGINGGIGFFKKKRGAYPLLPYLEYGWNPRRNSFARSLKRFFRRGAEPAPPGGRETG